MTMHRLSLAAAIVLSGVIAPLSIEAAATAISARLNAFQPESNVVSAAVRCWKKCIAKKPCGFRYGHHAATSNKTVHGKTCCLAYETVCPTPPRDISKTLRPIPIPTPGPPPQTPTRQLPARR